MALPTMARWLVKQRTRRNITQAQLADAVGKSRAWVSTIERGVMPKPQVEDCAVLAEYFGVTLSEVLAIAGYPLSEVAALRPLGAPGPAVGDVLSPQAVAMIQEAVTRTVHETIAAMRAAGWQPPQQQGSPDEPSNG